MTYGHRCGRRPLNFKSGVVTPVRKKIINSYSRIEIICLQNSLGIAFLLDVSIQILTFLSPSRARDLGIFWIFERRRNGRYSPLLYKGRTDYFISRVYSSRTGCEVRLSLLENGTPETPIDSRNLR
jgi:hypothetical protein